RTIWRPGQPSLPMKTIWQLPTLFFVTVLLAATLPAADYFPPRGEWAAKPPAELGFDAAKLQLAIDFSIGHENPSSKDVAEELQATFGKREPDYRIIGPTQPRAALNGIVIRQG